MSDIEAIDIRRKLAQIDKELAQHGQLLADRDRKRQEIQLAPWQIAVTMFGGAAAFLGAGAVLGGLAVRVLTGH